MEPIAAIHPSVAWTIATLAVFVFLAGFAKAVLIPLWHTARQVGQFLDDWFGRGESHPGTQARLDAIETKVGEVHHQTQTNGGESMKDAVNRTEKRLDELHGKFDLHTIEAAHRDERITYLENRAGHESERHAHEE